MLSSLAAQAALVGAEAAKPGPQAVSLAFVRPAAIRPHDAAKRFVDWMRAAGVVECTSRQLDCLYAEHCEYDELPELPGNTIKREVALIVPRKQRMRRRVRETVYEVGRDRRRR